MTMQPLKLKQGDTSPSLGWAVTPVNIIFTGALEIKFSMWDAHKNIIIDEADGSILDEGDGTSMGTPALQYDWVAGDTDTEGLFFGEFRVVYADSTQETFPNGDEYIPIQIGDDV